MAKKDVYVPSYDIGFLSCTQNKGFRVINPIVLSFNQLIWKNNIVFFLLIQKTSLSLQ